MGWKDRYGRAKARLLTDESVCPENRTLLAEFFEWHEHKLKRRAGLAELDEPCFKTLYAYVMRLRNVNLWFANKPWKELTRDDITRVYDGLEDGRIRTKRGVPFQDLQSYYNKILKAKPFALAGKADLAREIIEVTTLRLKPVRYVTEQTVRRLSDAIDHPHHRFLLWLAWDIGENVGALLQLRKKDMIPQMNRTSGEREYLVQLGADKIKRSRQPRAEVTLYPETAHLADVVLARLLSDDLVFPLGDNSARKFLRIAVAKTGATTMPNANPVRWKDLRSGMACHLLRAGWTRDEVNARLGHTPRSAALDAYINFMALDRDAAKRKLIPAQSTIHPTIASSQQASSVSTITGSGNLPTPSPSTVPSTDMELLKLALSASLSQIEALRKDVARLSVERAA